LLTSLTPLHYLSFLTSILHAFLHVHYIICKLYILMLRVTFFYIFFPFPLINYNSLICIGIFLVTEYRSRKQLSIRQNPKLTEEESRRNIVNTRRIYLYQNAAARCLQEGAARTPRSQHPQHAPALPVARKSTATMSATLSLPMLGRWASFFVKHSRALLSHSRSSRRGHRASCRDHISIRESESRGHWRNSLRAYTRAYALSRETRERTRAMSRT